MLHFETVDSPTLELLNKIMAEPLFSPLRLVGGTAMALQAGHRKSVDLDLFGALSLDETILTETVSSMGNIVWLNKLKNIKSLLVNGIKVDFVNYSYPWLSEPLNENNIRLASKKDIAAMKLSAITGRGAKKDFTDLYFLLKEFSLKEMVQLYEEKFADGSAFMVLKSLVYFEDAENDEMPEMLMPASWEMIKKTVTQHHRKYFQ
ncbi:MAG TPA: nucleotidyl transferase AbiEii/AbiGii toxin family protein [Chitinophagaceae bacterium]|nr:nucleotidyl transferase AbiEii/AbiGii toxin family protein [Chitinophagaceae bacterium]